jgi:hypothetical protein
LFEHDLFGKPVPTHRVAARGHAFPDHALAVCGTILLAFTIAPHLQIINYRGCFSAFAGI